MTAVTILMPVASPAPHLREALQSVLEQTHWEWKLILVNDGNDPSVQQLAESVVPAQQLTIVPLTERKGLAHALNRGLASADTDLVARLDADDIAHPDRLATQVELMEGVEELVLTGMAARLIDENGRVLGRREVRVGDEATSLLTRNQLIHPTVMFRRSVVQALGGYEEDCHLREDYELWLRLAAVGDIQNLDVVGIDYRVSPHQVSKRPVDRHTIQIVGRSQSALGRHLGRGRLSTRVKHVVWAVTQYPAAQRFLRVARVGVPK